MKSLAKNSVYNIVYQLLSLIFPLLSSMYVARIIFEDGVGRVAYAQNFVSYFVALALLGFPTYGIREIAKVKEDRKKINITFWELFLINAISTTLSSFVYIIALIYSDYFRNQLSLYVCVGVTLWVNYANIDWFYQGKEEYGYITVRSLAIKAISLICLVLLVKQKEDYIVYALISSCGTVCNYILNLIHARKYISFNFKLKKLNLKRHLKPLMILAIAAFLGNVYSKIDVTMLGSLSNDAVVGYYTNAHKIILIMVSCCIAVTSVFLPRLSFYYENDRTALEKLINFGTKLLITIVVPATICIGMLATATMKILYGASFAKAGTTLAIFAPLLLIRPIGDLLCYQLIVSAGKEKKRIYTSLIATISNIILNWILIPRWQQNGAAVASIISEFIVNVLLLHEVIRIVKINLDKFFLLKVLFSSAFMVLAIIGIKHIFNNEFLILLLSVFIGSGIYLLVNYLIKNEIVLDIYKRFMKLRKNKCFGNSNKS